MGHSFVEVFILYLEHKLYESIALNFPLHLPLHIWLQPTYTPPRDLERETKLNIQQITNFFVAPFLDWWIDETGVVERNKIVEAFRSIIDKIAD